MIAPKKMLTSLLILFTLCVLFVGASPDTKIPNFQTINSSHGQNYVVGNGRYQAYFDSYDNKVTFIGPNDDQVEFKANGSFIRGSLEEVKIAGPVVSERLLKNSNDLSLADSYMPNTETVYSAMEQGIKFQMTIPSLGLLPIAVKEQENATLDLDFLLTIPDNLEVAVNGHYWDKVSEVETIGDIVFYREGIPRLYFPKAFGKDAEGNTRNFTYRLSADYSSQYLTIRMDYEWLYEAKYPVVVDPSAIAGCIETTDLVNCSGGTFSGNWIDTNKGILIDTATINGNQGTYPNDGLVRLNSTSGSIFVLNSTITSHGNCYYHDCTDSYFKIFATNGSIMISNSTISSYGETGGGASWYTAGEGDCRIVGNPDNDITIRNSVFECNGGSGTSYDSPQNGASGYFRVYSARNFDINNTIIYSVGGVGGNGADTSHPGAPGGTGHLFLNITYNIAIRNNNLLNYHNGANGAYYSGSNGQTGAGEFYSALGHIAFGNGTWIESDTGGGTVQNIYQAHKISYDETTNITTSAGPNIITILPGGDNNLALFNTNMLNLHTIICNGTLQVGRSGRTDQNLNFSGCIYTNITKSAYGEIDWLYGDGTGQVAPVISNVVCTTCNAPANESPYVTTDVTPTFSFNTDLNAWCRIADENWDYSTMNSSRNCESGDNTKSHVCTLNTDDQLIFQTDYVYISCTELYAKGNTTAVLMNIQSLEDSSAEAITAGINSSSIWAGASIYKNMYVYIRTKDNNQVVAKFDRVATYRNRRWAFNYVAVNESSVGAFYNLTSTFYYLEISNLSNYDISGKVRNFINSTIDITQR